MRMATRVGARTCWLVILAALLGMLAACQSGSSAPRPAPDAQQVFTIDQIGPHSGNLVRLDPQQLYYRAEVQVAKEIFVGLLTQDQNGAVVPDGAAAMPSVSPDGLTYTFTLRSGLKWSDGTPITAQDFADAIARSQDPCIHDGLASLNNYYLGGTVNELLVGAHAEEAMRCPKNSNGTFPAALPSGSPIEGPGKAVEASDPTTLVLRLAHPAPYFLAALSTTLTMPVPKQIVQFGGFTWSQDKLCQQPGMGSGPFKCVTWSSPVVDQGHMAAPPAMKLVRNDTYYGGKAKIREIDYRFYGTNQDADADFEAGKANLVLSSVPYNDPSGTTAPPRAYQTPQVGVDYLQANAALPPFDNLDARLAFDAATDRVKVLSGANRGNSATYLAEHPTLNYIVPGLPGYNPNLLTSWGERASDPQALHGNLTAARAHMAKYVAAACNGDITKCPPVVFGGCDGNGPIAEPLASMWAAAFPGYPLRANDFVAGPLDCDMTNASVDQLPHVVWAMEYPADEDWYDHLLTSASAYGTYATAVSVPSADALVARANTTTDAVAAEDLYRQAEQLYVNQVAWIVLAQPLDTYALSKNVVGYAANDAGYAAPATLLSFYIAA